MQQRVAPRRLDCGGLEMDGHRFGQHRERGGLSVSLGRVEGLGQKGRLQTGTNWQGVCKCVACRRTPDWG